MSALRVGIIGCGHIFPMHGYPVHSLETTELVAVSDVKEDRAIARSKELGCKYYTDYKEMIEKEKLDVVHICLPHYLHPPVAIYAMDHGLNVLTEKPMSIKLEDAKAMVEAKNRNHVQLGVIFQNRYNAGSVLIKDALTSGKLGKIISGKLSVTWKRDDEYYSKSDWKGTWDKEGGGVIIDQAIHTMDLMRWFVDSDIEYVDASISNRAHQIIKVEDSAEGVIKFKNGVLAGFFAINYYGYDAPVEIELQCENGIAKMWAAKAEIRYNNGKVEFAEPDPRITFDFGNVKSYWGKSHFVQIEEFYRKLIAGEPVNIPAEDALKTQEMICAVYESGKEHKRIVF